MLEPRPGKKKKGRGFAGDFTAYLGFKPDPRHFNVVLDEY
jgi:hypothetical protein